MNAVIFSVVLMLGLSLSRVPVVAAIIISALCGGVISGMSITEALASFESGIGNGASIALSYALLGAFATALANSGIPQFFAEKVLGRSRASGPWVIYIILGTAAVLSQNLIPIHIAFIPLLVPALLSAANQLRIDRRAIACVICFGLVCTYMVLPVGFGGIYLNEILLANIASSGVDVSDIDIIDAMWLPGVGMVVGLLTALFISYRDPRSYQETTISASTKGAGLEINLWPLIFGLIAVVTSFIVQLLTGSMVLGALVGFSIFTISGSLKWRAMDSTFVEGAKMMANIGFIMIAASGFAHLLKETGDVATLVASTIDIIGNSQEIGILLMLVVGLFITMGIGSSFSTVPIIAALFVPLGVELGMSALGIVTLVGTAGALGDAGSPASDSTLGPTAGLNIDGQHDHIKETVIPTFLHFNIPLIIFGWIGATALS